MNKLFVFDLDDTLMDNVHDYTDSILKACRIIVDALGRRAPHVAKIIPLEQEIDRRRLKEINPATKKPYLYSMERFPGSLVETYQHICRQVKILPSPRIEAFLYQSGLLAFDEGRYQKNIIPLAMPTLDFLLSQGDRLILCSKGDRAVQEKKINALTKAGIRHFSSTIIVDEKTPETFNSITRKNPGSSCYSVGNSYSSDIKPALEAGWMGIYIPVEIWEDPVMTDVDLERCFLLENLSEIREIYERL